MNKRIDGDLEACLEYNPQEEWALGDIEEVLAVWEGQNDGDHWRWIIRLSENFVYLNGGCDFTGWDCQSWAYSKFADSALGAIDFELAYEYTDSAVIESLKAQLANGKTATWDEQISDRLIGK